MKLVAGVFPTAALIAALAALAPPAHAEVTIIDDRKKVTIDCAKDPEVSLIGNHIKVTLTGTCTRVSATGNHAKVTGSSKAVSLAGNHNVFTLDAVDDIAIAGSHNKVTYKKPATKPKTSVSNLGDHNTVTQAPK